MIPAVEEHFQVKLPASEIGYMTQHVLGAQKQNVPADEELYIGLAQTNHHTDRTGIGTSSAND